MQEINAQNFILTSLSAEEIKQMFREEIKAAFCSYVKTSSQADADEIGGIDLAIEITGLAKATIYSLVSGRKIPHSKRGKMLYFSRKELTEWLKQGKRKTQAEIAIEAENFGQNKKEAIKPTKQKTAS